MLSPCDILPFMIDERSDAKDDLKLKYRFLDLRSFAMQRNLRIRDEVAFRVREYLRGKGFYEIETPTLIRSTPEGARDFLVPSRIHAGKFYALPQSPQLFKQILMVSGFDKYFQIARCYRDEDARGDRQLEFTQIDLEMSFVSKDDVFAVIEGMLKHIFRHALDKDIQIPLPRIPWEEAMERYGSDKPDLRFGLELRSFDPYVAAGGFQVFKDVLASGGAVKALVVPGCGGYSRKQIQELEETAKTYKALGLAWMKVTAAGLEGGIGKFFEGTAKEIVSGLGAKEGDLNPLRRRLKEGRPGCLGRGPVPPRQGPRPRQGRRVQIRLDRGFSALRVQRGRKEVGGGPITSSPCPRKNFFPRWNPTPARSWATCTTSCATATRWPRAPSVSTTRRSRSGSFRSSASIPRTRSSASASSSTPSSTARRPTAASRPAWIGSS